MSYSTKLSVNINKIATLRNARGKNIPDLLSMAKLTLQSGAHGITIHPRPDQRHIRYSDIPPLKELIKLHSTVEFNIEGYPSESFLNLIESTSPDQCTLVPDPPDVLTSNAGWKFKENESLLKKTVQKLKENHIRSSLFLDPFSMNESDWKSLEKIKPDCIELYTEKYADSFQTKEEKEVLLEYKKSAEKALSLNIQINAGHDLNQANLKTFLKEVPNVKEVSIGQSLIAESLVEGLETTIKKYLSIVSLKS